MRAATLCLFRGKTPACRSTDKAVAAFFRRKNSTAIRLRPWLCLGTALLVLCVGTTSADLILSAPPRENADAGDSIYKPLAEQLTQLLHETVIYKRPTDWKTYERDMKNDVYDIVFDGPHFAAWRIQSLHARPLMRLPGSLRFVLVGQRQNKQVKTAKDLIGLTVCTLPAPNLGALILFSMFPYPARQPHYNIINGGFKDVAQAMQQGACDAAILRSSYYYKQATARFRDQTMVIQQSSAMTNQGITVSKRVPPELDLKIVKFLTSDTGKNSIKPILEISASDSTSFVISSKSDYIGQNLLQDASIFGW